MLITAEDAFPVFSEVKKVKETLSAYCLAADKVPVSLDDIAYAISEQYAASIETKTLPFKTDLLRGLIRIYAAEPPLRLNAQIAIDSELNVAVTRFVSAKEMAHIMLYNAENCTYDPTGIIEYFVQDGVNVANGVAKSHADIKNENLADIAAYELLFPHDLRADAKRRLDADEDDIFTIADWLEIPEHVVESVLSARYLAFSNSIWAKLS